MKKEIFYENRSKIYWVIGLIAGIYVIYAGVLGVSVAITNRNDQKADRILEELTYTEQNAENEMSRLGEIAGEKYISDGTSGRLYKALAELAYMTSDDMLYNKYIATAIYYLKEKDPESVIYLTNKYVGKLYANGAYEAAENFVVEQASDYKISDFSLEIQVGYYLELIDIAQMQNKNTTELFEQAHTVILCMEDGSERKIAQAKYDILVAREAVMNENWGKAEQIMASYSENDSFGYMEDQVYVVCDFKIPYEEIMAKIELHNGNTELAQTHVNKYIELCDQYQFRAMELNLLKYVTNQWGIEDSDAKNRYMELENTVMQKNLETLTTEYAQILLADMRNTEQNLQMQAAVSGQRSRYVLIGVAWLSVIIVSGFVISIIIDFIERDTLTKLNNRKKYEKMRGECDKKKIPYGYLMLDIDDFKKVNDTYGHHVGDVVLSGIAQILIKYTGRGIYAFRYGGEEMCMMF